MVQEFHGWCEGYGVWSFTFHSDKCTTGRTNRYYQQRTLAYQIDKNRYTYKMFWSECWIETWENTFPCKIIQFIISPIWPAFQHQGLDDFQRLFPDAEFLDLSQTPGQRARYGVNALPTLTRTCGYIWSKERNRFKLQCNVFSHVCMPSSIQYLLTFDMLST